MKLTKHELTWLKILEDPKKRKQTGQLGTGNRCCCLGYAGQACGLDFKSADTDLADIAGFDSNKIRLTNFGRIDTDKLSEKGVETLKKYSKGPHEDEWSLMHLNDGSDGWKKMPHRKMAKFIRENKEAVFIA